MGVDYAALKKGGFMRQKQKNHFSLRLAVVGGNLTAENLRIIADVAEKYGDGHVHLTSRQSVEIPFIKLENVEEVKNELATGGCKPGVCGPRVRTITACQGSAICPSGNIDTYGLAKKLDERYYARELPHKFKFGVTGCQNNCLKAEENDVGIKGASLVEWDEEACIMCGVCEKTCRENAITQQDGKLVLDVEKCNFCGRCVKACPTEAWKGTPGYLVSFGGLFGNRIYQGESYLPVITSEKQLFAVTDAAIQFFDDNANPGERFRMTLERVGLDKFKKAIEEAYNGGL
jgi:dissimilatory sulfite reductase (desulfoviridin) alpha/beta subunit